MTIDHQQQRVGSALAIVTLLWCSANLNADEAPAKVSFVKEIAPLLQAHCIACHHAGKTDGGLAVDTVTGLMAASDSGVSIMAGKSAESSLVQRLEEPNVDLRMPQKSNPLSPE